MAEKTIRVVTCDICKRERPAVARVTIDVCSMHQDVVHQHVEQHTESQPRIGRMGPDEMRSDEQELALTVLEHPDLKRDEYLELLQWDGTRTSRAYARMKRRGFITFNGHTSGARWRLTAKGRKEFEGAALG